MISWQSIKGGCPQFRVPEVVDYAAKKRLIHPTNAAALHRFHPTLTQT